ncbi:HlyD family secretion protein [Dehalobacterium formicoaceticum]|uniref:HlyD family secretion protein n=1 Tax=Dehalobacterium formicoaceticum TaxID=51515 RepID=UPI000B7D5D28|nr:efflux RND transporter periplasmic adaptor subunit [Dehalobacterium formicoaceticum]
MVKKLKNPKKSIIIGVVILGIIGISIIGIRTFSAAGGSKADQVLHTVLAKRELVNSISVSGNIESQNVQHVYSTLNYLVEEINVSIGDQVKKGDTLAKLDTSTLELDIAQQRDALNNSSKTSGIELENKKRIYQDLKSQYEAGLNAEIINGENSVKTAETDLGSKRKTYESNKILLEGDTISRQEFDQSETSYNAAVIAYDRAVASLKSTKTKIEQEIKTAEANMSIAQSNKDNDSQLIALQKLEKNLSDAKIKAPIDGTVTGVYAVEGSPGSGLLFVVEDTKNLMITTYVKEYDSGQVHPGQMVRIKSDATGDQVINGKVIKIAPASTKNAAGNIDTSGTVEFETEVSILDDHPELKIGMNTRLNIVLEEKQGVFAVPYDAVTTNSAGETIIYIVADEKGKQIVKEAVVKTGMETDLYTEVSGAELAEGVIVVNNAAGVQPGDIVDLSAPRGRR